MANPYGIEQVDVPGILNAYDTARERRVQMMLQQNQLEHQNQQLERETRLHAAYAKLRIPGADGGVSAAVSAYGGPTPPATSASPAAVAAPPMDPNSPTQALASETTPAPAISAAAPASDQRHPMASWMESNTPAIQDAMRADPEAGMRMIQNFSSLDAAAQQRVKERLELADQLNEHAIRHLATVHDQASWDAARTNYAAELQHYGAPVPDLPAVYDPKVVEGLRMSTLSTKEQFAQMKPVVLGADSKLVNPESGAVLAENPKNDWHVVLVHNSDGSDTPYRVNDKTGESHQLMEGGGATAGGGAPTGAAASAVVNGKLDPHAFFTQFVGPHEGGLNPHDANGAPTNHGINATANPGVDIQHLSMGDAANIFADKYFKASGAADLPPALAAVHADTYFINPKRAQQILQQSGGDPAKYMSLREQWLNGLVKSDPSRYGPYEKAWANRNRDLRQFAYQAGGGDAAAGAPSASPATGKPITGTTSGPLSDEAARFAAAVYKYKGTMPPQIGRTKGDIDKIMNLAAHMPMDEAKAVAEGTVQQWQTAHSAGQTLTAFEKGPQANQVRSLNVAIQHIDLLRQAATALQNGNVPLFNSIGQHIAQATGSAAPTNFDSLKNFVTDEVTKGVIGSAGGVQDREHAAQIIGRASSPAQLLGAFNNFQGLLTGQAHGLQQQYEAGTGRHDFADKYLLPRTRELLLGQTGGAAGHAPTVGEVRRGYRYQGGPPGSPSSWQKM